MVMIRQLCRVAALAMVMLAGTVHASPDAVMDAQVKRINDEWARIKYQVPNKSQQYQQLDKLAEQAAQLVAKYPGRAEPLLWQGIVTSEEAAQASVLKQLGLATAARDILLKAYKINPLAEKGGVAMSLGVLYYKVPGWPIGFGDSKKAKAYLNQGLVVDPLSLDTNWFFGDYWTTKGDKTRARAFFEKALAAPVDPTRPVWDTG
ncbi:MAG: tetratricopeptide repeat protein, partial [Sphingobium sp.]